MNEGESQYLAVRRRNEVRAVIEATGLYHSFQLPDGRILEGAISLSVLQQRLDSFPVPSDLRGKTLLDVGPWDGYFTFAMEQRGAQVTAIDYADLDTFRAIGKLFGSSARYERMDVYELDPAKGYCFDYVLFLGVLYHLKHPLLALEKVCAVTQTLCIVETFVSNASEWLKGERRPLPYIELYEYDQLGGQLDNWCGPSVEAVETLVREAGFARAEVFQVGNNIARVAAWRTWGELPAPADGPLVLRAINCHSHRGRTFATHKEQYMALWCEWAGEAPTVDEVFPEVDGFGVAPLWSAMTENGLLVSVRVPPGLAPGRHTVRLRTKSRDWSEPFDFFTDLPALSGDIVLKTLQDGVTWSEGEVDWANGGWLTAWVVGLSPEADPGNTELLVDGVPHVPHDVIAGKGQVNLRLRPLFAASEVNVAIRHRGRTSNALRLRIIGTKPEVKGVPDH